MDSLKRPLESESAELQMQEGKQMDPNDCDGVIAIEIEPNYGNDSAPPWTPLDPGFYSMSGGCRKTVTCFTRRSTMESSVVSSLPDCTFNPAERRCGGDNQL